MQIDADFESGNILVEQIHEHGASLNIRKDSSARYFQWFYFRARGLTGPRTFRIVNAAEASYPQAWPGYRVVASYDERDWFRIPTTYDESGLHFQYNAAQQTVFYAFFVPYVSAQREALRHACATSPLAAQRSLGTTVQGRSLDAFIIGDEGRAGKRVWIVARQHAGEPMAEWCAEGIIRRLLDPDDPVARALLNQAVITVIPNMNPDGSALGNLRANAAGVDPNRAWDSTGANCPEIVAVRAAMRAGVDAFIDVHGDEERPFIWLLPSGVPVSPDVATVQAHFEQNLRAHPAVQPPPTTIQSVRLDDPGMSVNAVAAQYHCLSYIVELPFKEIPIGDDPDSLLAEGCLRFGYEIVEALNTVMK